MDALNLPAKIAKYGLLEAANVKANDDLLVIGKKINDLRNGSQYQELAMTIQEFLTLATGTGYSVIQEGGVALPQRTIINFTGNGVNVIDNGGKTEVQIAGGLTGSGTLNYLSKWTPDGSTLGNSVLQDDGVCVWNNGASGVAGNLAFGQGVMNGAGGPVIGDGNSIFGTNGFNLLTTGARNTAVGYSTQQLLSTGLENTSVGAYALFNNESGSKNIALGYLALYNLSNVNDNVAIGHTAMFLTTTGIQNIAIGSNALRSNTTGEANVAIGHQAMFTNSIAIECVAIGRSIVLQYNR